jgi:hypothetical protein
MRLWALAVARAGTFAGAGVVHAWEGLDLPATETALGVRERLSPGGHAAVSRDGVLAYTWVKEGTRYRLRQLA